MTSYNIMFGNSSFIDFNASGFDWIKRYVYENPLDPRYVNPQRLMDAGANALLTGGTQNWHFYHHTNSFTGKIDFTSQLTNVHQMKAGVEGDLHFLNCRDYQVHVDASSGFVPALPVPGSFDFNTYDNSPYQLAAYIQDKIELSYLVVNVGLRFDYFQPDGVGLKNPNNIAGLDQLQSPFPDSLVTKASVKSQLSPRIASPIPSPIKEPFTFVPSLFPNSGVRIFIQESELQNPVDRKLSGLHRKHHRQRRFAAAANDNV